MFGFSFHLTEDKDDKVAKIDCIHDNDYAGCGCTCIPLHTRFNIVSIVEEKHEVVKVDEGKLIEDLEEIVRKGLLRHGVDKVHEECRIDSIECENLPSWVILQVPKAEDDQVSFRYIERNVDDFLQLVVHLNALV